MALSLGQVLSGAGAVARGQRASQNARQESEQLALQTAEQRRLAAEAARLDAMRDLEQRRTQELVAGYANAPEQQNLTSPQYSTRQIVPPLERPPEPEFRVTTAGRGAAGLQQFAPPAAPAAAPAAPAAAAPAPAAPERTGTKYQRMGQAAREDFVNLPSNFLQVMGTPQRLWRLWQENIAAPADAYLATTPFGEFVSGAVGGAETAPAAPAAAGVQGAPAAPAPTTAATAAAPAARTAPAAPARDPLTQAMIQVESSGRPRVVSRAGAVGLMQVRPSTAMAPGFGVPDVFSFAEQMGVPVSARTEAAAAELLKNPRVGAAYGQQYMDAMRERYNGNIEHALAAYNAGPSFVDRWIAAGADPAALPAETRAYIPKVLGELNKAANKPVLDILQEVANLNVRPRAGVETPAERIIPDSARYLANTETMGRDMQIALQQREQLVNFAKLYADVGKVAQAQQLTMQIMQLDQGMDYLQGMQGLQDFSLANDPRRLAAVWSQYANVPVGIRPRSDGAYDIFVNGELAQEGVSANEITEGARLAFDGTFRQQRAENEAEANMLRLESQLKQEETITEQQLTMIREATLENARGQNQLDVERLKQQGFTVQQLADGGAIITPKDGRSPVYWSNTGRIVRGIDGEDVTVTTPLDIFPNYNTLGLGNIPGQQ
jgi:soluble lytic murein transglycosylase-like protein